MDKPEDISVTAWEYGVKEAQFYADWLHAGNSSGELSEHAISGLADSFARLYASAQSQAYIDAARIAEEVPQFVQLSEEDAGRTGFLVRQANRKDISAAILQRKEEIGSN